MTFYFLHALLLVIDVRVSRMVTAWTHTLQVLTSNLRRDTGYRDSGLSWFS
jgi:hypothetical protein